MYEQSVINWLERLQYSIEDYDFGVVPLLDSFDEYRLTRERVREKYDECNRECCVNPSPCVRKMTEDQTAGLSDSDDESVFFEEPSWEMGEQVKVSCSCEAAEGSCATGGECCARIQETCDTSGCQSDFNEENCNANEQQCDVNKDECDSAGDRCDTNEEPLNDVNKVKLRKKSDKKAPRPLSGNYENIWECSSRFAVNYGNVERVSTFFEESINELSPVVVGKFDYTLPENVIRWASDLLYECWSEEEDQEFQSTVQNIDTSWRPPPFPSADDSASVLRHRPADRKVVARSQTIHVPPSQSIPLPKKEHEDTREIRGVAKVVFNGETVNCKGQVLKITDGKVLLTDQKGMEKTIKENVKIMSERKANSKVMELIDSCNQKIELKFDHSKDIEKYMSRTRSNSLSASTSSNENKKQTMKILRKFLGRRSSREILVKKGILKNEPIFGNTLTNLYETSDPTTPVPIFITKIIEIIERPYNITSLGLYRASGNLATIQKIRFSVDKNDLNILDVYKKDTDVLTGSLKMFFRELTQPLIPVDVYEKLLELTEVKGTPEVYRKAKKCLEKMEMPHRDTLTTLLVHLLKVVEHQGENKMSIQNMSIVWGPSLIFLPDSTGENLIKNSNNANNVIFLLLNAFLSLQGSCEEPTPNDCSPKRPHQPKDTSKFSYEEREKVAGELETIDPCQSVEDLTKIQAEPDYKERKQRMALELNKVYALKKSESREHLMRSSTSIVSHGSTDCCSIPRTPSLKNMELRWSLKELKLSSKSKIPEFLIKAVTVIEKHIKVEGLYTVQGNPEKVEKFRKKIKGLQKLSYNIDKHKNNPYDLTSILKIFVGEVIEPIIPRDVFEYLIEEFDNTIDITRQVQLQKEISHLDPIYQESLEYIMRHLSRVVECQEHNKMTKEIICEIWAPLLYNDCHEHPTEIRNCERIVENIFDMYSSHSPTIQANMSGSSRSLNSNFFLTSNASLNSSTSGSSKPSNSDKTSNTDKSVTINKPSNSNKPPNSNKPANTDKFSLDNTETCDIAKHNPVPKRAAKSSLQRLSKYFTKSVYDNIDEQDIKNEANFLDDAS